MTVDRDLLKRLAELTDGDDWAKADLLVEYFPPEEFGEAEHGENTGLREELDAAETDLAKEYGIELKASTMRHYRATAIKWPEVTRVTSASFQAHRALRGEDRYELMRVYLRKMKHEGKHALSRRMVMRYRSEDQPGKALPPWETQVARAVNSLAKRLVLGNRITDREDWWVTRSASPGRRAVVADALREMAKRLD